jgi:hypothetical protein
MWVLLLAGPSASRPSPQSDTCRRRAEKAAVRPKVTLMHHRGKTGVSGKTGFSKPETHLQLALELAQRVGQRVEQGDEVRAAHAVEQRRDLAANERTSKQTNRRATQLRSTGNPPETNPPSDNPEFPVGQRRWGDSTYLGADRHLARLCEPEGRKLACARQSRCRRGRGEPSPSADVLGSVPDSAMHRGWCGSGVGWRCSPNHVPRCVIATPGVLTGYSVVLTGY